MVRFFSSANSNLVASPKSPTLISMASLRKILPSLRSLWMTLLECMYSTAETSWCIKYRVSLGVNFFLFLTISLIVLFTKRRYLILAKFQDDVNELGVLEDTVELDDITLMQGFMDLDLWKKLICFKQKCTFCLALFFCRVFLSMTLIAWSVFV